MFEELVFSLKNSRLFCLVDYIFFLLTGFFSRSFFTFSLREVPFSGGFPLSSVATALQFVFAYSEILEVINS